MPHKAPTSDLPDKIQRCLRAKERGQKAYKLADRLLEEIALEVVPGTAVNLGKGRAAVLRDQFADKAIVWKPCGVRRFELEVERERKLREELDKVHTRRFPIQSQYSRDCPSSIPWSAIAPFENYAKRNHSQTLERLAERGGLSPVEAYCVIHGISDWRTVDRSDAVNFVRSICGLAELMKEG